MDEVNKEKLNLLLKDQRAVEEMLISQMEVRGNFRSTAPDGSLTDKSDSMSAEEALRALSNWTASITCSHQSYSNGLVKKKLTYSWKWEYSPVWTLTDKVAMAWSGNFTSVPESIYWTYRKNVGFTGSQVYTDYISESGYGYDDYEPNIGCGKNIDIRGSIPGTYHRYHAGTLSTNIMQYTNVNSTESAIGKYFHKKITPNFAITFSSVPVLLYLTGQITRSRLSAPRRFESQGNKK